MEKNILEFDNPEKAENEQIIISAAQELRRYPACFRQDDPDHDNRIKDGFSSGSLTRVIMKLISVLLDRKYQMPQELYKAVEFLTTDQRIKQHVQEMGLPTGTVRQLLSVIIHGNFKKVVGQFLGFYAETSEYCRTAAARALEKDMGAMDGLILEEHVILFELAIGFQKHMTSMTVVNSFVAHVVRTATTHQWNGSTERAIRMLETMFVRGEDISFKLLRPLADPCVGSTANPSTIVKLFFNYDFLKFKRSQCIWTPSRTAALDFLSILDARKVLPAAIADSKEKMAVALSQCLRQNDEALREATYKLLLNLAEFMKGSTSETQDFVLHIVTHVVEQEIYRCAVNKSLLNLCALVNDTTIRCMLEPHWSNLNFAGASGKDIEKACLMAKIILRENDDCQQYKNILQDDPIELHLTSNQILLLLYKFPILRTPQVYLSKAEWNLGTLQQVLRLLAMLAREVAAGKLAREKWDHGEFCTKLGIALLRQIMSPGFLCQGSKLFPDDIQEWDIDNADMDKRLKPIVAGIEEEVREEMSYAAERALTSRDTVFEDLLAQIVTLVELSLTVTDREIIKTTEFIRSAAPCVKGLTSYFPILACRLSVALTRAYLDPTKFLGNDFRMESVWEETKDAAIFKMEKALPGRLDLISKLPRNRENRVFLFEREIGDSVYDHHLYNSEEFWDWLTIRAFAVGFPDEEGVCSTKKF